MAAYARLEPYNTQGVYLQCVTGEGRSLVEAVGGVKLPPPPWGKQRLTHILR